MVISVTQTFRLFKGAKGVKNELFVSLLPTVTILNIYYFYPFLHLRKKLY